MSLIISMTGHRPDKLGGYHTPNKVHLAVVDGLKKLFAELKPSCVITGMALGVDQWAAEICAANGIPFVAAIPFHGQEGKWPEHAQKRYHALIQKAHKAWIISPGPYDPVKMHKRNHWMVDSCNLLVAVYDGSPGGTGACVNYAEKIGRSIHFLQLAPEIWNLADKMNPKKQQQEFDAGVQAYFDSVQSKATISPFLSLIKEKSEQKAKELASEAKAFEKAQAAKQQMIKKAQAQLKEQAMLMKADLEEMASLVLPDTPSQKWKPAPPKEEVKSIIQGFKRTLDLD